jgi:hypothetical protein
MQDINFFFCLVGGKTDDAEKEQHDNGDNERKTIQARGS